ncbi:MAG: DUF1657 domain-containing protein [Clostridiaceae bacterium]
MTVGTQMQQVIAGVESAAASMKTFALQTQDQSAKQDFQQLAKTFEDSLKVLEGRKKFIEEQEPQYKEQ